jgi:P4 family phage/plasmid primase-like protien
VSNASISQRLREQYDIDAHSGASKLQCPFCHHPALGITRDDTLAKCFHGSCGRFLTVNGTGTEAITLSSVLAEIYHDFHQELLRLKDVAYPDNAYNYLTKDRKIHPRVVEDAMLGAIPSEYDLESKFAPLLDSLQSQGTPQPKRRGRAKRHEWTVEERLQWIIEQREKLRNCLLKHAGWLAFFYTSISHQIVAIRFRKPGTKYFTYFKPYQAAGLFGHGLFRPHELNGLQAYLKHLIVTEGEFNQLQLQSLLIRKAQAQGKDSAYLPACAVGGVDNTDWGLISRLVEIPILVHDHDQSGASWVEDARQLMAVDACTTPPPSKDLDEYIRTFGDRHDDAWDAVKSLANHPTRLYRLYSGTGAEFFDGRRFVPKRLGDAIMERHHLKYAADVLWVYRDGVYRPEGEQAVKEEAHALLGEERTEGHVQETLRYIEVETYAAAPVVDPEVISLRNGRLAWRTNTLHPHTPDVFDILQLPVAYDPDATCPQYDAYLSTTLNEEMIPLADEVNGYCLIPDTRHEKAVMFVGPGSNGKSVYLDTLTALLGAENVSHVALQDLTDDKFQAAELLGKLANIFADLDSRMIMSSSRFKMLTTGDPITAQRKFGQPFTFTNYARMLFSANKIPRSHDTSYAFYRRWIVVELTKTFTGTNADKHLRETLRKELPGILNRALRGLRRLYDQEGFTIPKAAQGALAAYQRDNDTVAAFAADCLKSEKPEQGGRIIKQQLYRNYRGYCASQRWRHVSQREFKAKLYELFPDLDEGRGYRNTGPWQWLGIAYIGDKWGSDTDPPDEPHEG